MTSYTERFLEHERRWMEQSPQGAVAVLVSPNVFERLKLESFPGKVPQVDPSSATFHGLRIHVVTSAPDGFVRPLTAEEEAEWLGPVPYASIAEVKEPQACPSTPS